MVRQTAGNMRKTDAIAVETTRKAEEGGHVIGETIEAIKLIKQEFPKVYTSLGVSNISFGLAPHARHVLYPGIRPLR